MCYTSAFLIGPPCGWGCRFNRATLPWTFIFNSLTRLRPEIIFCSIYIQASTEIWTQSSRLPSRNNSAYATGQPFKSMRVLSFESSLSFGFKLEPKIFSSSSFSTKLETQNIFEFCSSQVLPSLIKKWINMAIFKCFFEFYSKCSYISSNFWVLIKHLLSNLTWIAPKSPKKIKNARKNEFFNEYLDSNFFEF